MNTHLKATRCRATESQISKTKSLACLTALSLSIGAATNVYAQQEQKALGLEEIIVTATRREEGLQSIPSSIAAVTGVDLENRGITDFTAVSESISGLTLDFPSNAINAAIYMRGVGTTGAATVQSVSTMIDGVYQIRQGLAFTELMDIERVEVLRGPQGTLFGKNSTSGAIRIFTADPDTEEFSGKVQGVVGNYDATELRGLVNVPIIEGILAARFSGYTAERDGYTENFLLGEETRDVDREGWRGKLLWDATETIQLKFTAENHEQSSLLDSGITQYSPATLATAASRGVTLPVVSIGNYAENLSGLTAEEVERYIFNFSWDLLGHKLSTLSSWEDNMTYLLQDRDETALTGTFTENTGLLEIETHEIQLASDFDGPLSYLIGLYYQSEDSLSITAIPTVLPAPSITPIAVESKAVFGNVTYAFNDQWSASIGLRRDQDERTGANVNVQLPLEFKETTYSTKVTYQLDADKMLYFSHDKGFKSGGVNREFTTCRGATPICLAPNQWTWEPEIAFNYELGMKSEWLDNRLRVNGAIFFTTFEDFQVSQSIPAAAAVLVSNAAEVEAKGIEVEFTAIVAENFTVDGSATYVQSEYTDYAAAPCAYATQPGCINRVQDLTGETLDHAPELSFNLGAEYRQSLASANGAEWFSRLDVVYKDDQNLFVLLADETEEGAYALWNARVGLETADSWRLTLWGRNLTDEEYVSAADFAGTGSNLSQIPGLPRMYGVTADWYF